MLSFIIGGCVDIQGPAPESLAASDILSEFKLSTDAIMMSMSDTLFLQGSAVSMDASERVVNPRDILWRSSDSGQVYVDTLGRVTARRSSEVPVVITGSYNLSGTTKSDQVSVYVTPTRIQATSVRLISLDSSFVGASFHGIGTPHIRVDLYQDDTVVLQGAQIPVTVPAPAAVAFTPMGGLSQEPVYVVSNNNGYLGPFWVRASVSLYGVKVQDSILFNGKYPASTQIPIASDGMGGVMPSEMLPDDPTPNLQPCGWIFIVVFQADRLVDVVFSDSTVDTDECTPIPNELLSSSRFGLPISGNVTGGNVTSVIRSGIFPTLWIRRSNTIGEITYYLRDAVTKERLPVSGRYRQLVVD